MFNSQNKIIILKQQLCIAGKKIIQMASKNERNDPTKLPQDRHPLKNLIGKLIIAKLLYAHARHVF